MISVTLPMGRDGDSDHTVKKLVQDVEGYRKMRTDVRLGLMLS